MIPTHKASYLLRFDDFCPTMKWSNWDVIESILREHDIRPIIAIIPDNRDPEMCFESPNPHFWDRVRSWQAAGWAIGLHGYQHTYVTRSPGLYSYRNASEFAGLPPELQREKLACALAIMRREGVHSKLWVAPGHSFDRATVCILRELGITSISDGFAIFPYTDKQGIFWVPQQLSERHMLSSPGSERSEPKTVGVWTVCCHQNAWTQEDIDRFRREVGRYRSLIRTVDEVQAAYSGRQMDWQDRVQAAKFEVKRLLRLVRFVYKSREIVGDLIRYQVGESHPVPVGAPRGKDQ